MKKVLKNTSIERFSVNELAELLINYKTIAFLALSYPNFYFDLDLSTGLVSDVDLADYLQFEVKGTPFGWKNNIESISDIKGLANLKHIRTLDLSNNLIEELIGLSGFKNLETIILANNKISDPKNVQYLNALPKLRYIDLSGNKIVNSITRQDFVHGPKVILKRFDARFEI
jgi:Leucine-rich repeat (LRR) protein